MPGVSIDVTSMKAADLKKELKARGLKVTGNKDELQERLMEALEAAEDVDDETEASLLEGGSTPGKKTPNKRVSISSAAPQVKIFKRDEAAPAATDEEKTPQEKRAERFGMPISSEAKKAARAARFGIVDPAEAKAARAARFGIVSKAEKKAEEEEKKAARAAKFGTGKKVLTPADIEQLKARAARFGEVSSKTLKKASLLEKKKERAERFKAGGAEITSSSSSTKVPITV